MQVTVISGPEEVRQLSLPDPHKAGLMPRVLETIRYFREHSDFPISFTDPQGPFTTALTLTGPATLFVWLYEYASHPKSPAFSHLLKNTAPTFPTGFRYMGSLLSWWPSGPWLASYCVSFRRMKMFFAWRQSPSWKEISMGVAS